VATSLLAVGDVIRVRPGDNVAADGVIVSGQGSFNQANITGESLAGGQETRRRSVCRHAESDRGAGNPRDARGPDTTLGKVRELILAAEKTKLPIMRIIDQYMGFYTPLVLVIGALVWAFTGNLNRVIAVFIVACPCAFILATPSAMVAALSAAARLGILIKNVGDIELAAKINAFVFDKTGTLTTGKLAVSRLAPMAGTPPAEFCAWPLRLRNTATIPRPRRWPNWPGSGRAADGAEGLFRNRRARGQREIDGAKVMVGRAQWLKDQGIKEDFLKARGFE
jgi:Zn2+/Cd2+-exporting ATPase